MVKRTTDPESYRSLSSDSTFTLKYVLPIVWIGGTARIVSQTSAEYLWLIFSVWLAASVLILFFSMRLKRVYEQGGRVHVSNYFKEITLAPQEIVEVIEHQGVRGNPITIRFSRRTDFGSSILLLAGADSPYTQGLVAEELRAFARSSNRLSEGSQDALKSA